MKWKIITSVSSPSRYRHSGILWHHQLIVFGGKSMVEGPNSTEKLHNDTFSFDLRTMIWSKLKTNGTIPSERHSHTATLTNRNNMVVIGGFGYGGASCNP